MLSYKTTEKQRAASLAYYYANREKARAYQEKWRREQGIPPRPPKMTDEQKLARVVMCRECGRQITTPCVLKKFGRQCTRCRDKAKRADGRRAKEYAKWRKKPDGKRARVRQYKLTQGCKECRYTGDPAKLHFHHRDPDTKLFRVAWAVDRVSEKVLWAEIEKCDVLCDECHKQKHGVRRLF